MPYPEFFLPFIFCFLPIALIGGVVAWVLLRERNFWDQLSKEFNLQEQERHRRYAGVYKSRGISIQKREEYNVNLERKYYVYSISISMPYVSGEPFTISRRVLLTLSRFFPGEAKTGDDEFDRQFNLSGVPHSLHKILTPEMRRRILSIIPSYHVTPCRIILNRNTLTYEQEYWRIEKGNIQPILDLLCDFCETIRDVNPTPA